MNQDDIDRQFHRDQLAKLASRRDALPASSHVHAAITDDLLDRLRDKIEKAATAADLDWSKWPMIFGFVEHVSDDAIALLDEDIDLVLAATPTTRQPSPTDFLKTSERNHPSRWFGGLFELWAKATLLRRAADVEFDAVLANGRNRDTVATINGRRFSFEFTVITEDDESRAVWERFIAAKKSDPTKVLVRPGPFDLPKAKGPSPYYVALRLYRKIFDKITNGNLDPAKSQCADDEPNILLVCFAGVGVNSREFGVNWVLEELLANHPKMPRTGVPKGLIDISLPGWIDFHAGEKIANGQMEAGSFAQHRNDIIAAPRRLGGLMLFDDTTFSSGRVNYNAHDENAITHAEMVELERVLSRPCDYWRDPLD